MMSGVDRKPVIPYAGPRYSPKDPAAFANGPFLVTRLDVPLAEYCIKCDEAADLRVRRTLLWIDSSGGRSSKLPYVRLFYALGAFVQFLLDMPRWRLPQLFLPVCARHARGARIGLVVALVALPGSFVVSYLLENQYLRIWAPVIGLVISGLGWRRFKLVRVMHVGVGYVTLAGISGKFLRRVSSSEAGSSRG